MPDEVAIPIEMKTGSSKYYRTRPPSIGGGGGYNSRPSQVNTHPDI